MLFVFQNEGILHQQSWPAPNRSHVYRAPEQSIGRIESISMISIPVHDKKEKKSVLVACAYSDGVVRVYQEHASVPVFQYAVSMMPLVQVAIGCCGSQIIIIIGDEASQVTVLSIMYWMEGIDFRFHSETMIVRTFPLPSWQAEWPQFQSLSDIIACDGGKDVVLLWKAEQGTVPQWHVLDNIFTGHHG
jgi:hypothetical protein